MSDKDDIFSTFIQLLLSHIAIQMFYHGILRIFARSAQRGIIGNSSMNHKMTNTTQNTSLNSNTTSNREQNQLKGTVSSRANVDGEFGELHPMLNFQPHLPKRFTSSAPRVVD